MDVRHWLWVGLLFAGAAAAQQAPPGLATLAERAAKRFPQPVRSGDLIGRTVLKPTEAQIVLGHVAGITRREDGGVDLVLALGGVLGVGARSVAVPVEALALLGEYVAVLDYTPAQLQALPTASGAETALAPDDVIRVGLTRPFH